MYKILPQFCDPHQFVQETNNIFESCTLCGLRHYLHEQTFVESKSGIEFMFIKGQKMDDEKKTIHDFYMSRTVVTEQQWLSILEDTDWSGYTNNKPHYPATHESYAEWETWLETLNQSKEHNVRYRLPTKKEWFYAKLCGQTFENYRKKMYSDDVHCRLTVNYI